MVKRQKVCKGSKGRMFVFIKSRFIDDLGLKGDEHFCMKKGRGKTLIIKFDCEEEDNG